MNDRYYLDPRVAAAYDTQPGLPQDDVPFYLDLARECDSTGQRVLELGCGTGRVTLPIAEADIAITGLDSSPAMLEVARGRSLHPDNPRWVEGDMAQFAIEERFGLVIIPCRSFGLLLTEAVQRTCLECAYEHLLSGGRLALNLVNPALWLQARSLGRARPASTTMRTNHEMIIEVERGLRQRLISPEAMERLLLEAGFAIEALYGWFDGRPCNGDSSEQVWIARRPRPEP